MSDSNAKPSLAATQRRLAAALASLEGEWPHDVIAEVRAGGTLDAAAALEVYRTGYVVRLTEQLGETYPSVWRVVGDGDFFTLCRAYIARHSSASYNLSDYGRNFAAALEGDAAAAEAPFLPELARFEWVFHELFHAPPHVPVPVVDLAALDDLSGVRLRLGSAVRLFAGEYAVYDMFRHRHSAEVPPIDFIRPQRVLMFKQGTEVLAREIDVGTHAALGAFSRGLTAEEAVASAVESDCAFGEVAVGRLFETLASCGLVASVER